MVNVVEQIGVCVEFLDNNDLMVNFIQFILE